MHEVGIEASFSYFAGWPDLRQDSISDFDHGKTIGQVYSLRINTTQQF